MILNHTRYSESCWKRQFNKSHRRFGGGSSTSISDGAAFHAGWAHGIAKKDWVGAVEVARSSFDLEMKKVEILEAESYLLEDHWDLTRTMLQIAQENFAHEDIQIVQPECEFRVDLTDDCHNCVWLHWYYTGTDESMWRPPTPQEILENKVITCTDERCKCFTRHQVCGKVDGVYLWKGQLWIDDWKTTALGPAAFWPQWALNMQPRIYLYGLQKALGIRPKGFIINAIFRPSEAQVSNWNSKRKTGAPKSPKDYIKYEREAFAVPDEDIERARVEFIHKAEEWESRIISGHFPMSPPPQQGSCFVYNRPCEFTPLCTSHDSEEALSTYTVKPDWDYVEKVLYQIEGVKSNGN